ncbi:MAG: gluconate permease [Planctomycetaceae bacterium]|nr:gluconate permease [Planctomycetales bacterium]MCB9927685.1 gluconate permease [Planctomycetaceae bacterium]
MNQTSVLCSYRPFLAVALLLSFIGPTLAQDAPEPAAEQQSNATVETSESPPPEATVASSAAEPKQDLVWPFVRLGVGVAVVLGLIIALKVNAFIALISAAIVVSLMSPGPFFAKMTRVAESFGTGAGNIGIVIALAAVIGSCLLDSGAADRIVRAFLKLLGEKRAPIALMGSGFVLAVPVFFDTVFYLLVPLARSLHRTTGKQYLKYIMAIAAGGAITHTLVPPTPGPLVMATTLGIDVGIMILIGGLVALPSAIAGLICSSLADRWMPVPMRQVGNQPDPEPLADEDLPPLWLSVLPVALPVLLISANTVLETSAKSAVKPQLIQAGIARPSDKELAEAIRAPASITDAKAQTLAKAAGVSNVFGNANFALLLSTVVALWMLAKQRGLAPVEVAQVVENSLMGGGVIILITAAGFSFGAMLKAAEVGVAIESLFAVGGSGFLLLIVGFCLAMVLKVAQGSSTAAMIVGSAMMAAIIEGSGVPPAELLGFHPVYLATAIGGGSLVGSWMNDSGFWIFAKMGGLTEVEALKSWTPMLVVLGVVSFLMTLLLANVMPLV